MSFKITILTVNGINLMDLQRLKKSSLKKTTVGKTESPQGRKKNKETTMPSSGNIKKYLTVKTNEISGTVNKRSELDKVTRKTTDKTDCGDKEDMNSKRSVRQTDNMVKDECEEGRKKTTFSNMLRKKSVKENIRMFQDLVDEDDCVLGGGWCVKHNVRLVRSVSKKKIASVSEEGGTTWLRGEAVISACPYKRDKQINGQTEATELVSPQFEGANGSKRFCSEKDMNQSDADRFERERL